MADNLPLEILSKIFSYLSLSDKLQCNLVCVQWRSAFLNPALHQTTEVAFDNNDEFLCQSLTGEQSLLDSTLTTAVLNLRFQNLALEIFAVRTVPDWSPLLARLRKLKLSQTTVVNESQLVVLLKSCKSLVNLGINHAREVFISGGFLSCQTDREEVKESLKNVQHLDLSWNSPYLTDRLFNRIVSCTPNVRELILSNTKLLSHSGIYKKFYSPDQASEFDSPSVLTWKNIVAFIHERSKQLTSLDFYNSDIPGLSDFAGFPDLELKALDVGKCGHVSQDSLLELCQRQPCLERLNLDNCRRALADNPAKNLIIFENLSRLQELSIKGISAPKGMENCLPLLDGLKTLDLSSCDIPSRKIADGLRPNRVEKLLLNSFGVSEASLLSMLPKLSALSHLELRNGHEGVTDDALQSIIKFCPNLNVLVLCNCTQLTDRGFVSSLSSQNASKPEDPMKIFLGSNAEKELWRDIKIRDSVAQVPLDSAAIVGIGQLSKLKHLELENIRLTEMAIIYAFKFDDLRLINLNNCKLIRDEGFRHLAAQNSHLEAFSCKQCNISGDSLVHLVKNCPRLVAMDLESCLNINTQDVMQLSKHCQNLRWIDLSFCRGVSLKAVENELLGKISSLRAIGTRGLALAEALRDYESSDEDIKQSPPHPPPPPRM